ncbi:hypothetical protein QFC19_002543 [Naganishia cerealis]|uniref:Uncharacterized protein n=1 Tax=Naganishia cerealis TaxID=610337 RepID=A0ACC2W9H7_9TREE|nr:hypothetical protein QFC19_002543 [Naganishia cerealis]
MHIFLTGAAGIIGSYTAKYLLLKGHSITAVDIHPLPEDLKLPAGSIFVQADCTDFQALEKALLQVPCDGVIHLGAIPNPRTGSDDRITHNVNVTASYNVLRTAADQGIKRIVQASSINATGVLYTHESRRKFEELPLTEKSPLTPEDPYSIICEIQADSICRLYDDVRISSLRFHHTCDAKYAVERSRHEDLWSWTSLEAAARACLLGVEANESSFSRGHEAFYILHDNLIFGKASKEIGEGFYDAELSSGMDPDTVTAKELVQLYYPGTKLKEDWWSEGNERRSLFDNSKAKRMLGWYHEK